MDKLDKKLIEHLTSDVSIARIQGPHILFHVKSSLKKVPVPYFIAILKSEKDCETVKKFSQGLAQEYGLDKNDERLIVYNAVFYRSPKYSRLDNAFIMFRWLQIYETTSQLKENPPLKWILDIDEHRLEHIYSYAQSNIEYWEKTKIKDTTYMYWAMASYLEYLNSKGLEYQIGRRMIIKALRHYNYKDYNKISFKVADHRIAQAVYRIKYPKLDLKRKRKKSR